MKPLKPKCRCFILFSFVLIISLLTFAFINEARLLQLLRLGQCAVSYIAAPNRNPSSSFSSSSSSSDEIRILIGILTLPTENLRRHLLRLVYKAQYPVRAKVDIKYVFCNVTEEDQRLLIKLEILSHGDIMILNCTENMNRGKTYTYFASLPELFKDTYDGPFPPYHYVMKADDDTFLRLNNLVEFLQEMPRDDFYFGCVASAERTTKNPFFRYMTGMGYLVSWDVVEWISESESVKKHTWGHEDMVFGSWLREGHKAKNRRDCEWTMYDYPYPNAKRLYGHDLWPNTIAVHRLKNMQFWIRTLTYFNITQNFKPSKFYSL